MMLYNFRNRVFQVYFFTFDKLLKNKNIHSIILLVLK